MSAVSEAVTAAVVAAQPVRIDLGAGKNPRAGFVGVDTIDFGNGNIICNIGRDRWPFADSSVDEACCVHVLEHLTNWEGKWERVHFFNELHRVLKPGASCQLIFPHWSSARYYGDPTHKEVISEFAFYYLDPGWRALNAPHVCIEYNPNGYRCDFEVTWGYALAPEIAIRSVDYQQHAQRYWLEARQDLQANVKARK